MTPITFNGVEYTLEKLNSAEIDELLALRNQIADNLGVAHVRKFADKDTAVKQTVKALERFQKTVDEEANIEGNAEAPKAKKAAKPKKEKGPYVIPKSAQATMLKRPNRNHFSTIKIVGEHDGTQGRKDRWPNYKDGMTIADVIEGEGTEKWDVDNWTKQGLLEIVEATDEQYAERRAAWYAKHGLTDPDVAKAQKAEERAKAKAEREAAAEAKKAEREKAKAAKAAEREAKAAEREAAKKAKEEAKAKAAAEKAAAEAKS